MSYDGFKRLRWMLMVEERAYRGERYYSSGHCFLACFLPPLLSVGSSQLTLLLATLSFKLLFSDDDQ